MLFAIWQPRNNDKYDKRLKGWGGGGWEGGGGGSVPTQEKKKADISVN